MHLGIVLLRKSGEEPVRKYGEGKKNAMGFRQVKMAPNETGSGTPHAMTALPTAKLLISESRTAMSGRNQSSAPLWIHHSRSTNSAATNARRHTKNRASGRAGHPRRSLRSFRIGIRSR